MCHGDTVVTPEHRGQYNVRFPLPLRQFNGIFRQVVRDRFEHRVESTQNQSKCLNDGDGTRTDCFNASFGGRATVGSHEERWRQ